MKRRRVIPKETVESQYYDRHGILKDLIDEPMEMSLKTELRRSILPYQILIRHWPSQNLKEESHIE